MAWRTGPRVSSPAGPSSSAHRARPIHRARTALRAGSSGPKQNVPCQAWTAAWTDWVKQLQPNVVVLLAGGGEILDRLYRGHMTNILHPDVRRLCGEPAARRPCRSPPPTARSMVFETKPCQSTGEQPDGAPVAAGQHGPPGRLQRDCCDRVAAQHPGQVYVQDLNSYVCPGGDYTEDLDGVPVRQSDGSHFAMQPGGGGDYLAPAILPYWMRPRPPAGGAARTERACRAESLPRYFAPQ